MIEIRRLESVEEYNLTLDIQRKAWGMNNLEIDPPFLMGRIQKYGGLVQGLFVDKKCVGFSYGVLGKWMGELFLFSYMTAVLPEYQGRGFGFLLKKAQREEVIEMGYKIIRWNFDPLEAQNAYFNVHRLGIVSSEYERDIYGEGKSNLHRGLSTDRLVATWKLDSEKVSKKMSIKNPPITERVPDNHFIEFRENVGYIEIPRDIRTIKKDNIAIAKRWRSETRAKFEEAFKSNYTVTGIVFSENKSRIFYKLMKKEA
ncbi:MAG: hypothetical protein ACXABU_05870 [Candidatus Hodarchaeales archaeon]|jgi:predicted GNAT superfamily acetyltransferase